MGFIDRGRNAGSSYGSALVRADHANIVLSMSFHLLHSWHTMPGCNFSYNKRMSQSPIIPTSRRLVAANVEATEASMPSMPPMTSHNLDQELTPSRATLSPA